MNSPPEPLQTAPKLIQDSDACKAIGCYVRAARNALSLSQSDLAEVLGVNRTTLLRLEKGISPLRFALCLSAVKVLGRLGAKSEQIENLVTEKGRVADAIHFTVDFQAMKRSQALAEQQLAAQGGIASLLGEQYVPPLVITPLRKK